MISGQFVNAQSADLNAQNRQMRVLRDPSGTHVMLWDLPNINVQQSDLNSGNLIGGSLILDARNNVDAPVENVDAPQPLRRLHVEHAVEDDQIAALDQRLPSGRRGTSVRSRPS